MDPHFARMDRLMERVRNADPDFSGGVKASSAAPASTLAQPLQTLPPQLPAVAPAETPVPEQDLRKLFGFGAGQGCQFVFGPITVQFTAYNVTVDDTTVSVAYNPKQVDFLLCRATDSAGAASSEFTVIVGTASYRCVFIGGRFKLPVADVVVLPLVRMS